MIIVVYSSALLPSTLLGTGLTISVGLGKYMAGEKARSKSKKAKGKIWPQRTLRKVKSKNIGHRLHKEIE